MEVDKHKQLQNQNIVEIKGKKNHIKSDTKLQITTKRRNIFTLHQSAAHWNNLFHSGKLRNPTKFNCWSSCKSFWSLHLSPSMGKYCPFWSWIWRTAGRTSRCCRHISLPKQPTRRFRWGELGRSWEALWNQQCSWSSCCRIWSGWRSRGKRGYCRRRILGSGSEARPRTAAEGFYRAVHCRSGCIASAGSWCTLNSRWCDLLCKTGWIWT